MDAGRIWLASTVAEVSFGLAIAFAAPLSTRAAGQSGWTSGSTAPATISNAPSYAAPNYGAPPSTPSSPSSNYQAPGYTAPAGTTNNYDRYGNPIAGGQPAYGQPATISQRTQNAVTETSNAMREGYDATVRAAKNSTQSVNQQFQDWSGSASQQMQSTGNTIQTTAQQAFGTGTPTTTPSSSSRYSSPFATQAPAVAPTTQTGRNAPPPWPTGTPTNTAPMASAPTAPTSSAPLWPDSSTGVSPAPTTSGGWTSIGSNVASPPMLLPGRPNTGDVRTNPVASASPVSLSSGPTFPTEQAAGQDNTRSLLTNQPQPVTTARSPADDAFAGWNNNSNPPRPTSAPATAGPPPATINRDFSITPAQPVETAAADNKKATIGKSNDLWSDDPWGKSAPATSAGAPATISATASKSATATIGAPPTNAPPGSFPTVGQPTIGSPAPNVTVNATNPAAAPPMNGANPLVPAATTAGEQRWVPMIFSVLALVGSLAGNFFLGWSYLDARQKYQSVVRRTADTFRRSQTAAA